MTHHTTLRAAGALLIVLGLHSVAFASTPATATSTGTQTSTSSWQDKLDTPLLIAAESAPDDVYPVLIRTRQTSLDEKAAALRAAGFTIHGLVGGQLLLSATAREAMVLAEDADIDRIALQDERHAEAQ